MILKNRTKQVQEVHKIKGGSVQVAPGGTLDIDEKGVYLAEIERIKKFFNIEKTKEVVKSKRSPVGAQAKPKDKPIDLPGESLELNNRD